MATDKNINGTTEGLASIGYADDKKASLTTVAGLIGAIAASSCCILPLVLVGLGIGGASVGYLTALAPYALFFKATTLVFVGYSHYLFYRQSKTGCAGDEACAKPLANQLVKTTLWVATFIIFVALVFPYIAPIFLGV